MKPFHNDADLPVETASLSAKVPISGRYGEYYNRSRAAGKVKYASRSAERQHQETGSGINIIYLYVVAYCYNVHRNGGHHGNT